MARLLRVNRGYAVAKQSAVTKVVPRVVGEHAIAWHADGLADECTVMNLPFDNLIMKTWSV